MKRFVYGLTSKSMVTTEDNITAYDVARFRLLSNIVVKSGNDERNVGVHDLNLLYKNKKR